MGWCARAALWATIILAAGLPGVAVAAEISPSPYWKNQILFPSDPFIQSGFHPQPAWVKFTIFTDDPETVYFQDSREYLFHYDFATAVLDPYLGISTTAFDQLTLFETGQEAILGTVILPPADETQLAEYGIQFVRQDPYTAQEIVDLFHAVKDSIGALENVEAFYFPTFEQTAVAEENRAFLESNGVTIGSAARWTKGNPVYANGWALGRLQYVAGNDIDAAYASGTLLPTDILLTDGVPAEVPFTAGILSLTPSTPNSHVAILANTYSVPFAFLAQASDAQRALDLVGHLVAVRTYNTFYGSVVRIIDAEGALTPQQTAEILDLKTPPELDIQPTKTYGAYSVSTEMLGPEDIEYVGGKAANYGVLRDAIPGNSRKAVGFTFDLWNSFLNQTVAGGGSLREYIAAQLAPYSYPPADMAALSNTLDGIRDFIKSTTDTVFAPALQTAVLATLQDEAYTFDPNSKIRFRSSTNVEDSALFTGAGLYDSFSGCLADDLDGDTTGPSLCDAGDLEERGVFRAIRKVFASFYNDNAYLERLRHGVDETEVGMGLLVHHSFPDDIEWANGVATLDTTSPNAEVTLVTQDGATSVANPEPGVVPEVVRVNVYNFGTYLTFEQGSSLVPLGAKVMAWEDDYRSLTELILLVGDAYEEFTGKSSFVLDLEYKRLGPGGDLVIKQVREIPQGGRPVVSAPFLINEPETYTVFQGEYGDVFANHRLKAAIQFETDSRWLDTAGVMSSIYGDTTMTFTAEGIVRTQEGLMGSWPNAGYAFTDGTMVDTWRFDGLANPRSYTLRTGVPEVSTLNSGPLLTLVDLENGFGGGLDLQVDYDRCMLSIDYRGPTTTTTDYARLAPAMTPQPGDLLQERSITTDGITIETSFYWPPDPGLAAGYTAPLSRWVETTITGYTTDPIVLTGDFSQTYRPEHHNFSEHYLFEPQLEEGIPQQQLDELAAKDIRLIYCHMGMVGDPIETYGFASQNGVCPGEGEGEGASDSHSADINGDGVISLSELLRVIQLHNVGSHSCYTGEGTSEDGYVLGDGDRNCAPHASDYNPTDWSVDLSELLRLIQFYNLGGYTACLGETEDGFCPVLS